jgi:hypothetical protein
MAVLTDQARRADALVDDATEAGGGSHPVTVQAKMLRQELLLVKADLERELGTWARDCGAMRSDSSLGFSAWRCSGHWAHQEPAPHGSPLV